MRVDFPAPIKLDERVADPTHHAMTLGQVIPEPSAVINVILTRRASPTTLPWAQEEMLAQDFVRELGLLHVEGDEEHSSTHTARAVAEELLGAVYTFPFARWLKPQLAIAYDQGVDIYWLKGDRKFLVHVPYQLDEPFTMYANDGITDQQSQHPPQAETIRQRIMWVAGTT